MVAYNPNRRYAGIPLGFQVRGSIAKQYTYQYRRGNGYFGTKTNKHYQIKYAYTVPKSIRNPQSDYVRTEFAQAVLNWQTIVTAEKKAEYNARASRYPGVSGYNLYIRDYVLDHT